MPARYPGSPYRAGSQGYGGNSGLSNEKKGFLPPPVMPAPAPPVINPPPPPAVIAAGGAAAAGAAGWPIALLAALGIGLYLGLQVRGDIRAARRAGRFGRGNPYATQQWFDLGNWIGYTLCGTAPDTNPTVWYDCGKIVKRYENSTSCNVTTWYLHGTASSCADLFNGFPVGGPSGNTPYITEEWIGRAPNTLVWRMNPRSWARTGNPSRIQRQVLAWPVEFYPDPMDAPAGAPPGRRPFSPPFPGEEPWNDDPSPSPSPNPAPIPWAVPSVPETFPPVVEVPAPFQPWPGSPWIVPVWPDIVISPTPSPGPTTRPVRPSPRPTTPPAPGPAPTPTPTPDTPPAPTPEPTPAPGGVGVVYRPPSAKLQRPDKNTKERKLNIRTVAGRAWIAINIVTEGLDFMNVLHGAIPKHLRCKGKWFKGKWYPCSTNRKFKDIYDHFEHIDLAAAVVGYINNQAEDYIYGMMGRATGSASRNLGITTGLSRAIRGGQEAAVGDQPFELPEIKYNPETGELGWSWGTIGGG